MNNYLSPSEIDLVCYIQDRLALEDIPVSDSESIGGASLEASVRLEASTRNAFKPSYDRAVLTYLCSILPSLLKEGYGIPYNKNIEKKLIGTKAHYNELLEGFLESLKEIGMSRTDSIRTILDFNKFPFGPNTWDKLARVIYNSRRDLKNKFSTDGWIFLKRIFTIMVSDNGIDEDDLVFLKKEAPNIPNKLISGLFSSLETDKDKDIPSQRLEVAKKSEEELTKKFFKKKDPSAEELKEFQQKFPDKYKEYRKAVLASRKAAKAVIEEEFLSNNYSIIDVKKAHSIMRKYGIPDPIDPNFVGKVGLGSTPSAMFSFYTSDGKLLDSVVRRSVTMNPKYSRDNDTYYCTHIPFVSKDGKPIKVYTADHWKKSHEKLYNGLRESLDVLEDVRQAFSTDVKPILNGKFTTKAIAALVCRVIDETAGRIGNADSENKMNTYGIHNLRIQHTRKVKNGFILRYVGKKGVPQEHRVEDAASVMAITKLIEDRNRTMYVFSKTGEKPVSPNTVAKYLKEVGFPCSPHMFRKIWAAKIFNEEAFKGKLTNLTEKQAKEKFLKAVEAVAKKLGQTEKNTSIKSYIDPTLMKKFWDKVGHKPPAAVQKAIDQMENQDPNAEE